MAKIDMGRSTVLLFTQAHISQIVNRYYYLHNTGACRDFYSASSLRMPSEFRTEQTAAFMICKEPKISSRATDIDSICRCALQMADKYKNAQLLNILVCPCILECKYDSNKSKSHHKRQPQCSIRVGFVPPVCSSTVRIYLHHPCTVGEFYSSTPQR